MKKQTLTTSLVGRLVIPANKTSEGTLHRLYPGGWNDKNSAWGRVVGTFLDGEGSPRFLVEADGQVFETFGQAIEFLSEDPTQSRLGDRRSIPLWDDVCTEVWNRQAANKARGHGK